MYAPRYHQRDVACTRVRDDVKIGFLGIQCDTANLGLAALAYSMVRIAHELIPGEAEFVLFSINSNAELERMHSTLDLNGKRVRAVPFWHKNPRAMVNSVREISSCDVIIDFTGGDSFSDIYGLRRLLRKLFHKQLVLSTRTPLVLGPQTYGPIQQRLVLPWFRHVIERSSLVFSRDELSAHFLRDISRREICVSTDVAVTLPWVSESTELPATTRPRVALNVSGLLWNGGYTGNNQFDLVADYREFCNQLVEALHASGYEVCLVSHVVTRSWESDIEDDSRAAREIHAKHPHTVLAPTFRSPVEAKSYISGFDVFIGSRMHATIAAFTSGVPTIPVSYSRKFEGFFGNLGYSVMVDLATAETGEAVRDTLKHVGAREALRELAMPAIEDSQRRIGQFKGQLGALLHQVRA